MSRAVETSAVVAALLVLTTAARADDGGWPSFAQTLGTQLRALEARFDEGAGGLPPWLGRFRISGNGDFAYLNGDRHSPAPGGRFLVDNSRLFLDSELVDGLRLGEWPLASDASFFVEWDAARDGEVLNTVGSFYLRLDHVLGLDPLNVKIGRVLIPFGEEYPRFSEQRPENPLISFSAAAPYGWDNGILFFGSSPWRSLQYVAGVMVGDTGFHVNTSRETQLDAKLVWQPVGWAHLSVSGLWTGKLGTHDEGGEAALEFGETEIRPFGSETDVTSFQNGAPITADPNQSVTMTAGESDLIVTAGDWGRLWLGFGRVAIRSGGSAAYDRDLSYGIAEGVFGLGRVARSLRRFYVAGRYSVIGTFDADEGYLIDPFNGGEELGFNTKSVSVVSLGVGWRATSFLTLKTEYSWYDFTLVRGVPSDLHAEAGGRNYLGVGASVHF